MCSHEISTYRIIHFSSFPQPAQTYQRIYLSTMASGLIRGDVNHSLFAIPVALSFAYIPHVLMISIIRGNNAKYENANPRLNIENLKGKVPERVWAKTKRAEAAHHNGLETFPMFACAVLSANVAGVDNATLNKWSYVFLVSRFFYNFMYIQIEDNALSRIRSVTWITGLVASGMLYFNAAKLKM